LRRENLKRSFSAVCSGTRCPTPPCTPSSRRTRMPSSSTASRSVTQIALPPCADFLSVSVCVCLEGKVG
jgi:hypothetical protein